MADLARDTLCVNTPLGRGTIPKFVTKHKLSKIKFDFLVISSNVRTTGNLVIGALGIEKELKTVD